MKITPALIFEVLKYWVQNGKTMTALISGVVIIGIQAAGLDLEQYGPEAKELINALVGAAALGIVGVIHKALKTIAKMAEKDGVS